MRLDRKDGIAKVLGTAFCVAGASVITLYKGPTIYSPVPPLHVAAGPVWRPTLALGDAEGKNWTLGCVYLIGHCLSWSGWLVLQAPVLKKYPARLSVTSYTCFFGLLQFLVISAFIERNASAWLVHTGAEVFSIFYAVRYSNLHLQCCLSFLNRSFSGGGRWLRLKKTTKAKGSFLPSFTPIFVAFPFPPPWLCFKLGRNNNVGRWWWWRWWWWGQSS